MKILQRYLPLMILLLSVSCRNSAQTASELPPEKYEQAISAGKVQLLDVRTAEEFRSGHLKDALQADWTDRNQFKDRTQHLDKGKPVFVYCLSGGRSAAAADYLRSQGFKDVTNLSGGINAWKRAGRPLVGEDPQKAQTTRADYDALALSAPTVIMDFGAEWCPPCRKMEPILAAFMKDKSEKVVKLVKMDGGNETALMQALNVNALPTFILYHNGKESKRLQGVMTAEELEKWVSLKD
jgi:rhodanese-related sulfurtransferase